MKLGRIPSYALGVSQTMGLKTLNTSPARREYKSD